MLPLSCSRRSEHPGLRCFLLYFVWNSIFTKKYFLATLLLAALPTLTEAATCTRADIAGSWKLYSVFKSVGRCSLIIPTIGTTISTSSYCYLPGVVSSTPLRGTLNLSTGCHVTGSITVGTYQRSVDAYISKGKDSISGIAWQPSNVYIGHQFSGVKQ